MYDTYINQFWAHRPRISSRSQRCSLGKRRRGAHVTAFRRLQEAYHNNHRMPLSMLATNRCHAWAVLVKAPKGLEAALKPAEKTPYWMCHALSIDCHGYLVNLWWQRSAETRHGFSCTRGRGAVDSTSLRWIGRVGVDFSWLVVEH